MTKKVSRRDAAKLLKLTPIILQRLAFVATQDDESPPDFTVWLNDEYTEQDNLLFRLFVELNRLLVDTSTVFTVLWEIWIDIDELVAASHRKRGEPPGVVVVGNGRYVQWPSRTHWLDTWNPIYITAADIVEPSLRITTAIHLSAMLKPLPQDE